AARLSGGARHAGACHADLRSAGGRMAGGPMSAQIDPRVVASSFGAASRSYDAAAWLQDIVRDELLSRLPLLPAPPRAVLDLGAGTGIASRELKRRFRRAQ